MRKIISASRRTDIPAFYAKWFMNRIREGYCTYPNPMYPKQIHRVDLSPDQVAGIVFWTRNARPLTPHLEALDRLGYAYYFLYTVVNYPRRIDPRSPTLKSATRTMAELANQIGPERIIWRYDPIILDGELTVEWHKENFARCLTVLSKYTGKIIVSVVDPYSKTKRRLENSNERVEYDPAQYMELLSAIVDMSRDAKLTLQSCAEPNLDVQGIEPGGCIDGHFMESLSGHRCTKALHRQRSGCLCVKSIDIGVNNTCGFGCRYCYANSDHEKALEAARRHNPEWPCLTGDFDVTDAGASENNTGSSRHCEPQQPELF